MDAAPTSGGSASSSVHPPILERASAIQIFSHAILVSKQGQICGVVVSLTPQKKHDRRPYRFPWPVVREP